MGQSPKLQGDHLVLDLEQLQVHLAELVQPLTDHSDSRQKCSNFSSPMVHINMEVKFQKAIPCSTCQHNNIKTLNRISCWWRLWPFSFAWKRGPLQHFCHSGILVFLSITVFHKHWGLELYSMVHTLQWGLAMLTPGMVKSAEQIVHSLFFDKKQPPWSCCCILS